jgi:diadenosine tetraphosphate (Ap4A) HIT family hydrolase
MLDLETNSCPFCIGIYNEKVGRVLVRDELSFCIYDAYPVSKGHCLIIPARHISSFFESNEVEKLSLMNVLGMAKHRIEQTHNPQGFNIGINDGPVAGQTIPHLHIHLIPRYHGDVEKPEGGVRWIFPESALYRE